MDQQFSPQEIKIVNTMIRQGSQVLLKDSNMDALGARVKQGPDGAAQAIAEAVLPVVKSVYEAATRAGVPVRIEVALLAGRELVKIVVAVLGAAGLIDPQQAGQMATQAFDAGVQAHNQAQGGQAMPAPQEPVQQGA